MGSVWEFLKDKRKEIIIILTPLLLLPLLVVIGTKEAKAAFIIGLMSVYWVTESIPLGVTALFPVVLVPLFEILPSREICPAYFKDSNMLFLGGLTLATSIEYWQLHRRIALKVLLAVGVQPKWLLFGFLFPSWILSMWISNTATTAMMVPIGEAVLLELRKHFHPSEKVDMSNGGEETPSSSSIETPVKTEDIKKSEIADETSSISSGVPDDIPMLEFIKDPRNKEFSNLCKMMMLSLAYGAVFGGVATLTGTAPNIIFNGMVQEFFGSETGFNYSSWFGFALPVSIMGLLMSWLWLQIFFMGFKSIFKKSSKATSREQDVKDALLKEYDKLGPISYAEVSCLLVFGVTVILWITREPGVPGWIQFFRDIDGEKTLTYMSDAQPAILMAILMFILPSQRPFKKKTAVVEASEVLKIKTDVTQEKSSTLLNWDIVHRGIPWQLFLLLGGGLALAETAKESNLSVWIGEQLSFFKDIPLPLLVLIICISSALLTEMTSNGTSPTILLPILANVATSIDIHPFFLMLSCTASCSFAFNLHISTPSNIMVYSRGYLTITDMIKCGSCIFFLSNITVWIATMTYGALIFDLWNIPPWANSTLT